MGDIRILGAQIGSQYEPDLKRRLWAAMYGNHLATPAPSYCYRQLPLETLTQWVSTHVPTHDCNYVSTSVRTNKSRHLYHLAPMYKSAIPFQAPSAVLGPHMVIVNNAKNWAKITNDTRQDFARRCNCSVGRSKSLEDVKSETSGCGECSDISRDRVERRSKNNLGDVRKSMDNLLEIYGRTKFMNIDSISSSDTRIGDKKDCFRKKRVYMVKIEYLLL